MSVQLNVKVDENTAAAVKKLAATDNLTIAELLRRYIEKGMKIDGYKQDIDFISGIIRQEFMAVYHLEDIKNVVEQQVSRIDKMLMKSGKLTAGQFFLLIKVMQNLVGREDEVYFAELVERADNMGIEFMQQKNSTINEILRDGKYVCDTVREQL